MDVIFLSRKYCQGEAWCNRLLAYAKGFQSHGVDVKLLFLASDEHQSATMQELGGLDVLYISELCSRDNVLKKVWVYSRALFQARKHFKKNDVVITTDGGGLFLSLLWHLKHKCYTFSEITEHPFVLGGSIGTKGVSGIIKRAINRMQVFVHNILIKRNTGIFAISDSLCGYFSAHGVSRDKLCKINMFVDAERFDVDKESAEPYVAYCGTISHGKDGVDILLKAFSIFKKDAPNFKLYLIGRFLDQQTQDSIENLIGELHLSGSVILTGKVSPLQMPRLLKNASILALSRPDNLQNRNGFPTKLGEYLATGNPVVVTSVGEIPKFLQDGHNAFLAAPDDVQSFADALRRVTADYDRASEIGRRGRQLAMRSFSSEDQTKIALDFIRSKISSK